MIPRLIWRPRPKLPLSDRIARYFLGSPKKSEEVWDAIEEDSKGDKCFDQSCFDDDAGPLVDEEGETRVPYDPNKVYEKPDVKNLRIFAVTYR